jgi:hypothetical protein
MIYLKYIQDIINYIKYIFIINYKYFFTKYIEKQIPIWIVKELHMESKVVLLKLLFMKQCQWNKLCIGKLLETNDKLHPW